MSDSTRPPSRAPQECGLAILTFLKDDPTRSHQRIPTTLVAMIICNLCVGILFFALGRLNKTSAAIGFVPASVISGFLSCIGYKVGGWYEGVW